MVRTSLCLLSLLALLACSGGPDSTTPDAGKPSGPGSLTGRVLDTHLGRSLPVVGATVKVGALSARTDDQGRFTLSGLSAGSVTLTMSAPQYENASRTVTVVAEQTTSGTDLTTSPRDYTSLTTYAQQGSGANMLSEPRDVRVAADGRVYLADMGNSRIAVFSPTAKTFTYFGSFGTGDTQLAYPAGITSDANHLYLSDCNNHFIKVFDFQGNFIRKHTLADTGAVETWYPRGLAWEGSTLHATGYASGRVSSYPGGATTVALQPTDNAMGLAVDSARGRLYVATVAGGIGTKNQLLVFTRNGAAWGNRQEMADLPDDNQPDLRPMGVTVDNNGYVWVADAVYDRVIKLTPELKFVTQIPAPRANAVAFDALGNLYIACGNTSGQSCLRVVGWE